MQNNLAIAAANVPQHARISHVSSPFCDLYVCVFLGPRWSDSCVVNCYVFMKLFYEQIKKMMMMTMKGDEAIKSEPVIIIYGKLEALFVFSLYSNDIINNKNALIRQLHCEI